MAPPRRRRRCAAARKLSLRRVAMARRLARCGQSLPDHIRANRAELVTNLSAICNAASSHACRRATGETAPIPASASAARRGRLLARLWHGVLAASGNRRGTGPASVFRQMAIAAVIHPALFLYSRQALCSVPDRNMAAPMHALNHPAPPPQLQSQRQIQVQPSLHQQLPTALLLPVDQQSPQPLFQVPSITSSQPQPQPTPDIVEMLGRSQVAELVDAIMAEASQRVHSQDTISHSPQPDSVPAVRTIPASLSPPRSQPTAVHDSIISTSSTIHNSPFYKCHFTELTVTLSTTPVLNTVQPTGHDAGMKSPHNTLPPLNSRGTADSPAEQALHNMQTPDRPPRQDSDASADARNAAHDADHFCTPAAPVIAPMADPSGDFHGGSGNVNGRLPLRYSGLAREPPPAAETETGTQTRRAMRFDTPPTRVLRSGRTAAR